MTSTNTLGPKGKLIALAIGGVIAVIASCSASGDDSTPTTPTHPTSTSSTRTPTGDEPAPAAAKMVPMPDVVGMNLQAAQNLIQEAGVWYSRSEDATGQGRMQVLDSNWTVVAQSPSAGELIGEGDALLSVVKNTD